MAAQTLYLRSTQSTVVTSTTSVKQLSTTQGSAVNTGTSLKNAKTTGTWQFKPGTAVTTLVAASPGVNPKSPNLGFLFDGAAAGTYDAGNWTFQIETSNSSASGTAKIEVNMWVVSASTTAVTELRYLTPNNPPTSGQSTATYTPTTSGTAHSVTVSLPAITLSASQYLYLEVFLNFSVAGSSTTGTETLRLDDTGTSASKITTTNFTAAPGSPTYQTPAIPSGQFAINTGNANFNVTLPNAPTSGNMLVAQMMTGDTWVNANTGWSIVKQMAGPGNFDGTIAVRLCDGTDTATVTPFSTSGYSFSGGSVETAVWEVSGADIGNVIASGSQTSTANTPPSTSPGSCTTVTPNAIAIACSASPTTVTSATPSGFTSDSTNTTQSSQIYSHETGIANSTAVNPTFTYTGGTSNSAQSMLLLIGAALASATTLSVSASTAITATYRAVGCIAQAVTSAQTAKIVGQGNAKASATVIINAIFKWGWAVARSTSSVLTSKLGLTAKAQISASSAQSAKASFIGKAIAKASSAQSAVVILIGKMTASRTSALTPKSGMIANANAKATSAQSAQPINLIAKPKVSAASVQTAKLSLFMRIQVAATSIQSALRSMLTRFVQTKTTAITPRVSMVGKSNAKASAAITAHESFVGKMLASAMSPQIATIALAKIPYHLVLTAVSIIVTAAANLRGNLKSSQTSAITAKPVGLNAHAVASAASPVTGKASFVARLLGAATASLSARLLSRTSASSTVNSPITPSFKALGRGVFKINSPQTGKTSVRTNVSTTQTTAVSGRFSANGNVVQKAVTAFSARFTGVARAAWASTVTMLAAITTGSSGGYSIVVAATVVLTAKTSLTAKTVFQRTIALVSSLSVAAILTQIRSSVIAASYRAKATASFGKTYAVMPLSSLVGRISAMRTSPVFANFNSSVLARFVATVPILSGLLGMIVRSAWKATISLVATILAFLTGNRPDHIYLYSAVMQRVYQRPAVMQRAWAFVATMQRIYERPAQMSRLHTYTSSMQRVYSYSCEVE